MIDQIKQKIRKRTLWDSVSLLFLFISCYVLFITFNVIDFLHELSHHVEVIGIAEVLPTLCVMAFGFAIFSYRRWKDTKVLSLYAEELSMIDPLTNLPNRRAVQRVLNQINERQEYPVAVAIINIEGLENIRNNLGLTVAEHVLIEILYHISKNLNDEQLVAYWQSGQFVCLCPGFTQIQADNLNAQLSAIEVNQDRLLGYELNFSSAALSVSNKAELENVFSNLEDTLI